MDLALGKRIPILFLLGVFLVLSGCATLPSGIAREELLPSQVSAGVYLDLENNRELIPALQSGGLLDPDLDEQLVNRVSKVFLAVAPEETLVLIQGQFPSFLLQWQLRNRFHFKRSDQTELYNQEFPRHRVFVPTDKTRLDIPSGLGPMVDLILLDSEHILVRFQGDNTRKDLFPSPWSRPGEGESEVRTFETPGKAHFIAAFTPGLLGVQAVEIELEPRTVVEDTQEHILWDIILGFYQDAGNPSLTQVAQRGLGSLLRLFSRNLILNPAVPMDAEQLRQSFELEYTWWNTYGRTRMFGMTVKPEGSADILQELLGIFKRGLP